LDFKLQSSLSNNYLSDPGTQLKDVNIDYDVRAIETSIRNIFNTKPGEKILNPAFGLDLSQYLFEPISEETAREIGNTVLEQLPLYEPRVILNSIDIVAKENNNEYIVTMSITVPELNNLYTDIKGVLDTQGFRYN
jgi:phage baseplate assembly protein W